MTASLRVMRPRRGSSRSVRCSKSTRRDSIATSCQPAAQVEPWAPPFPSTVTLSSHSLLQTGQLGVVVIHVRTEFNE